MGFDDQIATTAFDSGNPYAIAGATAYEGFKSLTTMFHKGSREANQITPVQNAMWAVVSACGDEYPMASPERLVQLRDTVTQAWSDFETWVRSQQWTDGRAAQQALDRTKDPYISVQRVLGWINGRLAQLSGTTDAGGVTPSTNKMLWVGGGLLAAKLLGFL